MQRNWIGRSRGRRGRSSGSRAWTRTSRSSPRGRTRSTAARTWCWRPSTSWSSDWPTLGRQRDRSATTCADGGREQDEERTADEREDRRLHGLPRGQSVERRAHPDVRRRLRPRRLRHRRDHGRPRARRARLRLRADLRSAGPRRSSGRRTPRPEADAAYVEHTEGEVLVELGRPRRRAGGGGRPPDRRAPRRRRARPLRGQLPHPRLGLLASALLGLPDPDRLLRHVRRRAAARRPAPRRCCPRWRTTARRAGRRWRRRRTGCACRAPGAAAMRSARRRRWTRSSTPPGTSCATATRTTSRSRSAARSPTTGTRSTSTSAASDHAIMHMIYARFWIKVLNDLGLVGFREPFARFYTNGWVTLGNVKMSKRAGNIVGPDDFVERFGADACRLNILFLGPADQDMEWTEESIEGMARFVRRLWRVVGEAGRARACRARRGRSGPARAQGARDHREGHRRHRPPLRLQHRDRGGDGARERALPRHVRPGSALRGRDGRLADPAVRAARRGGALAAARQRAPVGDALAHR